MDASASLGNCDEARSFRTTSFFSPTPEPTTHNPQPTTHNPQPTTHNPYLASRLPTLKTRTCSYLPSLSTPSSFSPSAAPPFFPATSRSRASRSSRSFRSSSTATSGTLNASSSSSARDPLRSNPSFPPVDDPGETSIFVSRDDVVVSQHSVDTGVGFCTEPRVFLEPAGPLVCVWVPRWSAPRSATPWPTTSCVAGASGGRP